VFPHADGSRNGPDDFVVLAADGPWPAGTFVTRRPVGAYLVTTESRFVVGTSSGFAFAPAERLAGYDSSGDDEMPSGALFVSVCVSWTEHGDERAVTRSDTILDESRAKTVVALVACP
jgi:hypothetical protein